MAAQSNRTVTLTLNAQTTGTEGIVGLSKELEKMAKKGGDAAPELERLSRELDAIAQQQDSINALQSLATSMAATTAAMKTAQAAADTEKQSLDALRATLKQAAAEEEAQAVQVRAAAQARRDSNISWSEAKLAVSQFVAGIGGAKHVTDENRDAYNQLKQAVRDTKAEYEAATLALNKLTPEFDRLKTATAEVAASVKKQENEFRTSTETASRATTEYTGLKDTLADVEQHAQKLGVNIKNLSGEQNRLQQTTAQLTNAGNALKQSLLAPGEAALTSAQKIERAFAGTGVIAASKMEAEIRTINAGLMKLATDASVTGDEFDHAFSRGKARIAELEGEIKRAGSTANSTGGQFKSMFAQVAPASLIFNGVSAAISAIGAAATKIPQVAAEFQTMERTLRILTGTTESARKEMAYIADVSNRAGLDIKSTGDAYIKLTAATKDSNLEGAQTRRIFEAVSGAMGVLGASSAEAGDAIMAVTQMVSKGVVSMEEMRQQLGERLPQSFQATAKELGITTAELNDLISSGKLAASDMLPALAAGLEKVYKTGQQNDTLTGKWNQFTTALKLSGDAVGNSGLVDSLLKVGRVGSAAVVGLGEDFILLGKAIGKGTAGIMNGTLSQAMAELKKDFTEVNARIAAVAGFADPAGKSISDLAAEAKSAGKEFFYTSDGVKVLTASVAGASNEFIKFSVENTKAFNSAEVFATMARRVAETTRAAGEASITSANAIGTETEQRITASRVAEANTLALNAQVEAERKVITTLEEQAMVRAIAMRDGKAATDEHVKQLVALDEEIQKRKGATDGLAAQAEANRVLAESLRLKAQLEMDNSTRVVELKTEYEKLDKAVRDLAIDVATGVKPQEELNKAEEASRKVKRLLLDALDDQIKKSEAVKDAKLGQLNVDQANVRLAIEVQKGIQNVATARGNESTAIRAGNEIKRLEVEMAKLTALAKQAEAEASQLVAEAKIEELRSNGPMTAAKEAEIRSLEAAVRVKQIEAKIAGETVKALENVRLATIAAANASGGSVGSYNAEAGAMRDAAAAARDLANAKSGGSGGGGNGGGGGGDGGVNNRPIRRTDDQSGLPPGIGSSGSTVDDPNYTHGTSFNNSGPGGGAQASRTVSGMDALYKSGASVQEAQIAAKYMGELAMRYAQAGSGQVKTTEDNNQLIKTSTARAVQDSLRMARQEIATGIATDLGPSVADVTAKNLALLSNSQGAIGGAAFDQYRAAVTASAQEASKGITQPVNITIGGRTQSLNVASPADAHQLTNILRLLENDSTRAF